MRIRSFLVAVVLALVAPLISPLVTQAAPAVTPHAVAPKIQRVALSAGESAVTTVDRFDAIGVSWDRSSAKPSMSARVKEATGWTDWTPLELPDIGPDGTEGATPRDATEALVTNGATAFQVRVASDQPLHNVRAELVDAGTSPADGAAATSSLTAPQTSGAVPSGAPSQPPIITRAQWGADESLRGHAPDYFNTLKVGVIHHTVTTNSYSPSGAYAEVRAIYAYHTQSLGWSDIAYNVLVDRFGQIFEGRYGGLDQNVLSAATGGFNTSTFSVSALGNFQDAPPSSSLLESISQILAWRFGVAYVNPVDSSQLRSAGFAGSPYAEGEIVTVPDIIGHRDLDYTACPGQYLYPYLDAIRNRVLQLMPAGLVHPAMVSTPRTPGANGSVHVTSGMIYGGDWGVEIHRPDGSLLRTYVASGWSIDVTWPMTDTLGVPVPEGTYQIVVKSTQNGVAAREFAAAISTSELIGTIDSVQPTPNGNIASGWVSASNGASAEAVITVDGTNPVTVPANQSRPDVAAAYPGLGPLHGFSAAIGVPPGVHVVCLWGQSTGLISRLLACRYYDNPPDAPFGNVDTATPLYGGLQLTGWAIDRNTVNPITARFYPDGTWGRDQTASLSRPDVAAAYPAYGPNHGFDAAVNTGPGRHWVCVNGINVGAGASERMLGCAVAATRTGPPIGNLDQLDVGSGTVTVRGWTFDPDTTAPIAVHVYVDGGYGTGSFAGSFAANGNRNDLSGPYPFMGTQHGFASTVGMSTVGHHTVCVYAINAGAPDQNPLLGCRSFG